MSNPHKLFWANTSYVKQVVNVEHILILGQLMLCFVSLFWFTLTWILLSQRTLYRMNRWRLPTTALLLYKCWFSVFQWDDGCLLDCILPYVTGYVNCRTHNSLLPRPHEWSQVHRLAYVCVLLHCHCILPGQHHCSGCHHSQWLQLCHKITFNHLHLSLSLPQLSYSWHLSVKYFQHLKPFTASLVQTSMIYV